MDTNTDITQTDSLSGRIHYMDNLRAWAMLTGIIFHASLAYSPLLHNIWLTADSRYSVGIDAVAWLTHLFRMPVFFLIAGFFAYHLMEKRGVRHFLKNRLLRIAVPFVVFLPLCVAATGAIVGWAVERVNNPSPMLAVIRFFRKMPGVPPAPVTTMHLWFLYQLLFLYVLAVLLYMTPALKWLHKTIRKLPRWLLWCFPLLLFPALVTLPMPHPAPESFVPQLWSFGFYGLFFLFGFLLYKNMTVPERLQKYGPYFLAAGVVLHAVFFHMLPSSVSLASLSDTAAPVLGVRQVLGALLESYIAFAMTVGTLLFGKKYLNRPNAVMQYLADSSYWMYLVHLPLLFAIQFWLLDVGWNMWLKWLFSCAATLGIGMGSYVLLVRGTFVGRLLNGKTKPVFTRGKKGEHAMD